VTAFHAFLGLYGGGAGRSRAHEFKITITMTPAADGRTT
jgi:hypothetical protein